MTKTTNIYGVIPATPIKTDILNLETQSSRLGVSFPLYNPNNEAAGIFSKTRGISALKSRMLQLLSTTQDERLMLPNFGTFLEPFLFEPLTEEIEVNIKSAVMNSIAEYLPEAIIYRLTVKYGSEIGGYGLPAIIIVLVVGLQNEEGSEEVVVTA